MSAPRERGWLEEELRDARAAGDLDVEPPDPADYLEPDRWSR